MFFPSVVTTAITIDSLRPLVRQMWISPKLCEIEPCLPKLDQEIRVPDSESADRKSAYGSAIFRFLAADHLLFRPIGNDLAFCRNVFYGANGQLASRLCYGHNVDISVILRVVFRMKSVNQCYCKDSVYLCHAISNNMVIILSDTGTSTHIFNGLSRCLHALNAQYVFRSLVIALTSNALITGYSWYSFLPYHAASAVALHCCNGRSKINTKMETL